MGGGGGYKVDFNVQQRQDNKWVNYSQLDECNPEKDHMR